MKPHGIVSDEDVDMNHFGNFGIMSPRRVVDEGVLKAALGYHSGSTVQHILHAHDLIEGYGDDYVGLTVKGMRYLRSVFAQKGLGATIEWLASEKTE